MSFDADAHMKTGSQNLMPRGLMGKRLREMFERLLNHYGPQKWWPAESALEMMVGAILTQNTNWNNVTIAIENLKGEDLLSLEGLLSTPTESLAKMIRPAGYYNLKARRLKNLLEFVREQYNCDLSYFLALEIQALRHGLLSVKGVGPETADSIILYAARKPIFVIDAYTQRILVRHGIIDDASTYDQMQSLFMDCLPADPDLYGEFHALIVKTGKHCCRKAPLCESCPLTLWGHVAPLT
jgi:endonuclease-3 related protein